MSEEHTTENKDNLKRFFNDEYIKHVEKIKHTITLQLDHDLQSYVRQMNAIVNQIDSMRTLIEQIHSNTIKEEKVE